METEWRPVRGYEGIYEVNTRGDVKSLERIITYSNGNTALWREKEKKQTVNQDGYMTVKLSKNGNDARCFVHRIVYEAFVGDIPDGCEINHKDFDRKNNAVDNLEAIPHRENVEYTVNAGRNAGRLYDLRGENNPNYGNRKLSALYTSNHALSIEKQGRPGLRNGRCRPVTAIFPDGKSVEFKYMTACAEYLIKNGYTNAMVDSIISAIFATKYKNKRYLGIEFIF